MNTNKNTKLKIILGSVSLILFLALIYKLLNTPGGLILPGFFLGGMLLIGVLIGCVIVSALLNVIFRKSSFLILFLTTTIIAFSIFHYKLYSPTLTIVAPKGFKGEVYLVLSNQDQNRLTLDTNGIGYLNKSTFKKLYTKPVVVDSEGNSLEKQLVGFNPTTFFAKGKFCCINNSNVQYLSFEIVPEDKIGQKQYYHNIILSDVIDRSLVQFSNENDK